MGHFDRGGNRSGGGFRGGRDSGGFGGGRDSGGFRGGRDGGRDGGRPQMHRATCSECGNSCEVPFKPSGSKPVFCSNCFDKQGGSDSARRPERRDSHRPTSFGGGAKRMFKANCAECDGICEVPFEPREGRSIFCDSCFSKQKNAQGGESPELKQKIDALHVKMDRILKLLGAPVEKEVADIKKAEPKAKKEAKEVKKEAKAPAKEKKIPVAKKESKKSVKKASTKKKAVKKSSKK